MNTMSHIEPGTILKVWCPNKFVWHYGVMSTFGMVIDRGKKGILRRSWYEFSEGQEVKVVPLDSGDFSKEIIHRRALARVGQGGYDMIFRNCEHFVSWCRKNKFTSQQLTNAAIIIVILGLIFAAFRSSRKNENTFA